MSALPVSHETWFVDHPDRYPLDWSALGRPAVVLGLVAVVVVALAWRAVAARLPTPELPMPAFVRRLTPWTSRLLAVHLGASLLLLAWQRSVVDPAAAVGDDVVGTLLLAPQVVAGVLLILGVAVRAAALLVVAAGPVLFALTGVLTLLSSLVLLGVAGYLVLLPPERTMGGRVQLPSLRLRPALLLLRAGTAGTLIVLAVIEKLANPAMAAAMLDQQPLLQVLAPFGIGAVAFAVIAGLVEVLFGLLVLSGAAPQVVALVAAVPFTLTIALFGVEELAGHLPVYGVLLLLLVLGSSREVAAEVGHLPRTRQRDAADPPVGQRGSVRR